MIIHLLSGLIIVYVLIRLVIPLRASRAMKLSATALLLLVSQQHVIIRNLFGGMASPELPVPLLLASGWSFASLLFVFLLLLMWDICLLLRLLIRGARKAAAPPFSQGRRQAIVVVLAALSAACGVRQGVVAPEAHDVEILLP
ncbi:MAG: metallophosphoesterase, partial [Deltaproteobacteria bacterium]|nr:metallophosphoesterase [Deltaproteobacteria bacterium]